MVLLDFLFAQVIKRFENLVDVQFHFSQLFSSFMVEMLQLLLLLVECWAGLSAVVQVIL